MEEKTVNLEDIFSVIKKRIKFISVVTVLFTIGALVISSYIIKPKYEVSTKLFVGKDETREGENSNYNSNDIQMYQKIIDTYADVIETKTLINQAMIEANINIDYETIRQKLSIKPMENTQLIEMKYISTNQEEAKNVIEAINNKFISFSVKLIPNANVQVVEEPYFPKKPVSPNVLKNTVLGFLLGILSSSSIIIMRYFMDSTYTDKEKIESDIGLPVIGDIPKLES